VGVGGDWEFGVAKGNLTNLAVDITMSKIDGTGTHHHAIESLRNVTGAGRSEQIALTNGNYTDFKGIADITTNGEIKWKDVPLTVHLANGNIISFNIDPSKTEDHFKVCQYLVQ
jgi:YbbR domain-containing protein